jgi:P27 family predicted phage terminase small subunit
MSNRAKPSKIRLLEGNRSGRPINANEPEPTPGTPEMPEWLRAFPVAVAEWNREIIILNNMRVLTVADGSTLAIRAYLASQIQELAQDIKKEGRTFQYSWKNTFSGEMRTVSKSNPKTIQIKNLITEHRQLGSLFGFDPSSRTKLSVTDGNKPSKFDGLINLTNK